LKEKFFCFHTVAIEKKCKKNHLMRHFVKKIFEKGFSAVF